MSVPALCEMKKPSVVRCLFGRPSSTQKETDFRSLERKQNEEDAKQFKEKWGIDPSTGEPVEGAEYEFTPVDPQKEFIPGFYLKGYSRKPRQRARARRDSPSTRVLIFHQFLGNSEQPMGPRAAKRKLTFNEDDDNAIYNDENREVREVSEKRVPDNGEIISMPELSSSMSSLSSVDSYSPSSGFEARSVVVNRSSSSTSLPDLVRVSGSMDFNSTPKRTLSQRSIKDFMPLKKQRCMSKALPRT